MEPRGEIGPQGGFNRIPESGPGGPKGEVPRGEAKHARKGHIGSGHGPSVAWRERTRPVPQRGGEKPLPGRAATWGRHSRAEGLPSAESRDSDVQRFAGE